MKVQYLSLPAAVEEVTGRRPHLCTCLRWAGPRGLKGIVLESWMIGGRRCTTIEAVKRFIEETTHAASRAPVSQPTRKQLEEAKKRSDAILDRAGI